MFVRTYARNAGRVLGLVVMSLLLFVAVYIGVGLAVALILPYLPVSVPTSVVVGTALVAFIVTMVRVYREYPEPRHISQATDEVKGWFWWFAAIDVVLGIIYFVLLNR